MDTLVSQATFVERSRCINCGSTAYHLVSSGKYTDEPLHGFITSDPWGENPLPSLQRAAWYLVRCVDCDQLYHRFTLDAEWQERKFSTWMNGDALREFSARLGPRFPRDFSSAIDHVKHVLRLEKLTRDIRTADEPVRLLDFGCGFGSFVECCLHFGFDAIGVDRAKPRQQDGKITVYPSLDAVGDRTFHVITLFEVLEHLDAPADILKVLKTRLAPGGILLLETPDCAGVHGIRTRHDYAAIHPLEHINAFTHETLKSIAERQGFRCIARPLPHVAQDRVRTIKDEIKFALGKGERTTQLYFSLPA